MRYSILLLACFAAVATGSWIATVMARPNRPATAPAVLTWLNASERQRAQIEEHDRTFHTESTELLAAVRAQRQALSDLLMSGSATDEQVLAQVDRLAAAERDLQKRVALYVLRIRDHLTPEQQVKLMELFAGSVSPDGTHRGRSRGPGPHRGPPTQRP